MSLPIVILNYKTYYEATGWRAINLSESADRLAKEYGINVVVAPQFVDISPIADQFDIPVFAQHVDPITPGSHTGYILPESIKEAGAVGTLLNHAERKIPFEILENTVELVKKLDLKVCICAENLDVASKTAALDPDYIAFELPDLIGSGKSISTTEPDLVKSSVKQILDVNSDVVPLCGAGISDADDVYAALTLGTRGVLLASAFTKARDPEFVLRDLLDGVKKYLDE
ncbi:MAG: triose-phosphate isomerase [Promethearchaeota archaeon]|nr:MAG: triose-phosphate isomerase [Candidatus Lokiarchaeota archaeon]